MRDHNLRTHGPGVIRWSLTASLVAAVISTVSFDAPLPQFDAGIASSAATFSLHGLLPYRDYWLLYGPLSGWILAIPVAVFGPSILLLKVVGVCVVASQAFLAFRLAVRWTDHIGALLVAVVAVLPPVAFLGLAPTAWSISMLFALLALDLFMAGRTPLLLGAMAGLTFLTRLDVGAYLGIALLIGGCRWRLAPGFLVVVLPVVGVVVAMTPIAALAEQLIWYPLVGTRQFRGIPDVASGMLVAFVPLLAASLAIAPRVALACGALQRRWTGARSPDQTGLLAFAALCQLQTLGRADAAHLALAATPSLLLLSTWGASRLLLARAAWVSVLAASVVGSTVGFAVGLNTGREADLALRRAVEAVRGSTEDGEPLFVGLTANRYTLLNPMLAYFLSDRPPASRITMYNPGISNRDDTQAEMIMQLESSKVSYLILNRAWAEAFEYSNDSRLPGSEVLDRYIAGAFRIACDYGSVVVAARLTGTDDLTC